VIRFFLDHELLQEAPVGRAKTGTEIVRASQDRNREAGGGRVTLTLSPDDMALWREWLGEFEEGRGQQITAFRAMLQAAVSQGGVTKAQVLDWIDKHT